MIRSISSSLSGGWILSVSATKSAVRRRLLAASNLVASGGGDWQHHHRVPAGAESRRTREPAGRRPRADQGRRTLPRITLQQLLDLEWRRRPGDRVVVLLGHCGERAYLPNRTQRHDRGRANAWPDPRSVSTCDSPADIGAGELYAGI